MGTHLITGAGSGIGAAVARQLLDRGDDLVLLARNETRAADLRAEFAGAEVLVADLAALDVIEGLPLPPSLDSVIHAAGTVDLGSVANLGTIAWIEQLTVNLVAPAVLTRAALPALRRAQGTVVFVNSGAGLHAHPEWSAYAASKHGLRALADSLRAEESGKGVRVTSVYPGRTATAMQEKVHRQEGKKYVATAWIRPETVADTIRHVLDLPRDATLPDVSVRPGI